MEPGISDHPVVMASLSLLLKHHLEKWIWNNIVTVLIYTNGFECPKIFLKHLISSLQISFQCLIMCNTITNPALSIPMFSIIPFVAKNQQCFLSVIRQVYLRGLEYTDYNYALLHPCDTWPSGRLHHILFLVRNHHASKQAAKLQVPSFLGSMAEACCC